MTAQALPMEPSLRSAAARLELTNGAHCRSHHGQLFRHKRSLGVATADQLESRRSIRHFACTSLSDTPHRNIRFSVSGTNAMFSGDVVGRRHFEDVCGLQPQSRRPELLCLFKRSGRMHASNRPSFGYLHFLSSAVALSRREAKFSVRFARKDWDAQATVFSEQSNAANEELLLFFFQLDLTIRLQRALNLDQYEVAQQLREKIVEVDKEVQRLMDAKFGSPSSKSEAQDKAIAILRLKNNLQQAVEAEDYNGAAELRDQISKLEAESLAATARALAFQNVVYSFRLGQKVQHAKFGYRGVICGMDPFCSESDSWPASSLIQGLPRGRNQPFYQVLVDVRAEPDLLVSYVAEENLIPPKEPDKDSFDHPYVSFLFYGMDSAGDFIPIKQLREKYSQPRHELPWEEKKKGTDSNDDDAKP